MSAIRSGDSQQNMHWSSFSEFLRMGGSGFYVWGSYGITFVLLAGEVLVLLKRKRNLASRQSQVELETRNSKLETVS